MSPLPFPPWSLSRRAVAAAHQMRSLSDPRPANTRSAKWTQPLAAPQPAPGPPPALLRDPLALPTLQFAFDPAPLRAPETARTSKADRDALPLRALPAPCKVFRRPKANANTAGSRWRESTPGRAARGNSSPLPGRRCSWRSGRCRQPQQHANRENSAPTLKCSRPPSALPPELKSRSRCLPPNTTAATFLRTPRSTTPRIRLRWSLRHPQKRTQFRPPYVAPDRPTAPFLPAPTLSDVARSTASLPPRRPRVQTAFRCT